MSRVGEAEIRTFEADGVVDKDGNVELVIEDAVYNASSGEYVASGDEESRSTFKVPKGTTVEVHEVRDHLYEDADRRRWLVTVTTEMYLLNQKGEYRWYLVEHPYMEVRVPPQTDRALLNRANAQGELIYDASIRTMLVEAAEVRANYDRIRRAEWDERQADARLAFERRQADLNYRRRVEAADRNLQIDRAMADARADFDNRYTDWQEASDRSRADARLNHQRAMADWQLRVDQAIADADLQFSRDTTDWQERVDRALIDARAEFDRRTVDWRESNDRAIAEYDAQYLRQTVDIDSQNTLNRANYDLDFQQRTADIDLANTRALADAREQYDRAMADWQLENEVANADARLSYDTRIADLRSMEQQLDAQYRAAYERSAADATYQATMQDAYLQAQFQQSSAYADAYNRAASESNTIASLYNAVASGQPISVEQQQILAQYVASRPEIFNPANGLLSSEQLSRAFTDPSALQSAVTAAGQPLAFMPAQPDGSPTTTQLRTYDLSNPSNLGEFSQLMTALHPTSNATSLGGSSDFSEASLRGLSPQEVMSRYSFACTCPDYSERSFSPDTSEARSWTTSDVPTLYGQRVCRHILATWNQLGIVTAADIPRDLPDA